MARSRPRRGRPSRRSSRPCPDRPARYPEGPPRAQRGGPQSRPGRFMTDAIARSTRSWTARRRAPGRLRRLPAHPQHRHALRASARTWSPRPRFVAEHLERWGLEHVEVSPTGGHPVVYADWLHAEGARRSWSTATTTSSRSTRSTCGCGRRSSRGSRTAASTRVAPRTTRARSTSTSGPRARGWRRRAGCPSTCATCSRARRSPARPTSTPGSRPTGIAWPRTSRSSATPASSRATMPAITVGLRGLMYAQIDVTGPDVDLHSGTWGGNVQNPAIALAAHHRGAQATRTAASPCPASTTRSGPSPSAATTSSRGCRSTRPPSRRSIGVPELFGEPDFLPLERRGARPTLDVNGIWGGFQGEGSKTIIPAHAHAKVSCRLVADMDPVATFERVRDARPGGRVPGVRVEVRLISHGHVEPDAHRPSGDAGGRGAACARSSASDPYYLHEGGSIPAAASFATMLGPARRAARLHQPRRPGTRPQREHGARQLRGRHPDHRALLGGAARPAPVAS